MDQGYWKYEQKYNLTTLFQIIDRFKAFEVPDMKPVSCDFLPQSGRSLVKMDRWGLVKATESGRSFMGRCVNGTNIEIELAK